MATDGALHTRYIDATVSTPPQTLVAAPQSTVVALGQVTLLEAYLVIPPGHVGLTGWQLQLAQVQVVPYGPTGSWVTGDDDKLDFTFERAVGLGLVIVTYNLGQYPHLHLCRMKVTDFDIPVNTVTTPTPIVSL